MVELPFSVQPRGFSCQANSRRDPSLRLAPRACRFSTTLHKCYTHVSDWRLRSTLKRKRNHLSIEQALERVREGEKTHTHSYVNML